MLRLTKEEKDNLKVGDLVCFKYYYCEPDYDLKSDKMPEVLELYQYAKIVRIDDYLLYLLHNDKIIVYDKDYCDLWKTN